MADQVLGIHPPCAEHETTMTDPTAKVLGDGLKETADMIVLADHASTKVQQATTMTTIDLRRVRDHLHLPVPMAADRQVDPSTSHQMQTTVVHPQDHLHGAVEEVLITRPTHLRLISHHLMQDAMVTQDKGDRRWRGLLLTHQLMDRRSGRAIGMREMGLRHRGRDGGVEAWMGGCISILSDGTE
jgi:hypothetical protein